MGFFSKITFLSIATCGFVGAAELDSKGILTVDTFSFRLQLFDTEWRGAMQGSSFYQPGEVKLLPDGAEHDSTFRFAALPEGKLRANLRRGKNGQFQYHGEIAFPTPVTLYETALAVRLPISVYQGTELLVDGKPLTLPPELDQKKVIFFNRPDCREIRLNGPGGEIVIRGNFGFQVQDGRCYGDENYEARIRFVKHHGEISSSTLDLVIEEKPYASIPLDLRSIANMGLTDQTTGDGKGGWTDQGPENDLRQLPVGRRKLGGIEFDIIDPAKNGGHSCLMMAGRERPGFARSAVCEVPVGARAKYLYLLHATAWADNHPAGTLRVFYADGDTSSIPVKGNFDVGNWWTPTNLANADVVWQSENRSAYIGLYRSRFELKNKPLDRIEFLTGDSSVWGIVAASLSDAMPPRETAIAHYIAAGKDWLPVASSADVQPGSALDFSARLDAPAGKYGPAQIRADGRIAFRDRPEQPVRFYGTNLISSAVVASHDISEKIADRIAAMGFNIVRIHHHDDVISNRVEGKSTDLHPVNAERLDYLIACLKKRGIYITTDLHCSRHVAAGEIPEDPGLSHGTYQALFWILDSVFENWKGFSRSWLNHVNPYTGLALKDDPVLVSVGLVNEGNIAIHWNLTEFSRNLYETRFREWLAAHHPEAKARADVSDPLFSRFLLELYLRRYKQMVEFVRGEGVTAMLSDQSRETTPHLVTMREKYDYVDNHVYWSHPTFPGKSWSFPMVLDNRSVLPQRAIVPGELFASRIFGKPFSLTEYDFALPNRYRAEGGPVGGAYAALQGWDIFCQFAYSHELKRIQDPNDMGNTFDMANDIVKRLSHLVGARLFVDGELRESDLSFVAVVPKAENLTCRDRFSFDLARLGLIARVGSVAGDPAGRIPADTAALLATAGAFPNRTGLPVISAGEHEQELLPKLVAAKLLKPDWYDVKRDIYRSSTGQIELDAGRMMFRVNTPSCEVLILPEKTDGTGSALTVRNRVGRGVFAALSVEPGPLAKSRRILLLHLTDILPTRMKFADARLSRLEAWGTAPLLAERGEAEIALKLPKANAFRVYALDVSGKRLGEMKTSTEGKSLTFEAKVFHPGGIAFAYEIVR